MRSLIFLLLFSLLQTGCLRTQGGNRVVAKITAIEGDVRAISCQQEERMLSAGSSVYLGDLIAADKDGKAQLQFSDGMMMDLIPTTEFRIDAYQKPRLQTKGMFYGSLLAGGLRVATGIIGKKNPENYRIDTPNASLSPHGTVFRLRLFRGELFAACEEGLIALSNETGAFLLGPQDSFQYACVSSSAGSPAGRPAMPDPLARGLFLAPQGAAQIGRPLSASDELPPQPSEGAPVPMMDDALRIQTYPDC